MSATQSQPCACGGVVFDLSKRKDGEDVTCPFCAKEYFYEGSTSSLKPRAEKPARSAPPAEANPDVKIDSALGKASPGIKYDSAMGKTGPEKKSEDRESEKAKADFDPKKPKTNELNSVSKTDRQKPMARKKKEEPPGGMMAGVAFIVIFSGLAFVALAYIFPRQYDDTRITPWGSHWRSSVWPEVGAIIAGHIFGFIAYGIFLHHMFKKQRAAEAAQAAELPAVKAADSRGSKPN